MYIHPYTFIYIFHIYIYIYGFIKVHITLYTVIYVHIHLYTFEYIKQSAGRLVTERTNINKNNHSYGDHSRSFKCLTCPNNSAFPNKRSFRAHGGVVGT